MKKNNFEIQYKPILKTGLITIVVMAILLYAPSPFVVIKPGIAVSSHSFVTVIDERNVANPVDTEPTLEPDKDNTGTFLLTAVLMDAPNIMDSLLSLFQPQRTVMWKYVALGGVSVQQYAQRATTKMQGSYDHALEAAYHYLNIEYNNEPQQLYVNEALALGGKLQSGDRIDGIYSNENIAPVKSIDDIVSWLKGNTDASSIEFQVERMAKLIKVVIQLDNKYRQNWDDRSVAKQLGVDGFLQLRSIVPTDEKYKVKFDDSAIGGPSAGLVLTLTLIDQLTDGDLTKGRKIAVTGTIDGQGHVGAIGGIKQKVYSTAEQGAEIFIVPYGNKDEASKKVGKLRSNMKIIAVSTLEEAMEVIASINN